VRRRFPTVIDLAEIVKLLLVDLGVDVANQHFRGTPERVARFYREFTSGFCVRPETILKTFRSEACELVAVSAIDFFSLCPHHLLVYGGKIHFGYIPNGQIVGVSKIPRLVHALAARPIVQEELVSSIADAFMSVVKPSGCIVKAVAKHDCVAVRGVHCPGVSMTTVTKEEFSSRRGSMLRNSIGRSRRDSVVSAEAPGGRMPIKRGTCRCVGSV